MAETQAAYVLQPVPVGQAGQPQQQRPSMLSKAKSLSAGQIVSVITLLPLGGLLLTIAGLTFAGTLVALAVSVPVFILFSPVLVPAAITIALSVTGILTSGAFGVTGMSSLAWIMNYLRQVIGKITQQFGENVQQVPDYLEGSKKQIQDYAGTMGQKTKELGQQLEQSGKEAKASQRSIA